MFVKCSFDFQEVFFMTDNNGLVIRKCNLPAVVNDNSLVAYFEKIKSFPVLSEEQETSLVNDLQQNGNMNAAQILITSHLRLAAKIALTYRCYGLPLADVISEANITTGSYMSSDALSIRTIFKGIGAELILIDKI